MSTWLAPGRGGCVMKGYGLPEIELPSRCFSSLTRILDIFANVILLTAHLSCSSSLSLAPGLFCNDASPRWMDDQNDPSASKQLTVNASTTIETQRPTDSVQERCGALSSCCLV
jgi:hypothetical protein